MLVLEIDLALAGTIAGLLVTAFGAFGWLIKMDRAYHDLPKRVEKLEMEQNECPARDIDVSRIEETLNELSRKTDNDFAAITQQGKNLEIMMEGLCAVLEHMETGNHTEQMASIRTKMMTELIRSRKEVMSYD